MLAGTVVLVLGSMKFDKPELRSVSLARGDHTDELPLQHMHNRERFTEIIWNALLSTAPTPPLADDALVG